MPRKPAKKPTKRKKAGQGPFDAVRWEAVRDRIKPIALGLGVMVAGVLFLTGVNTVNARAATELGADRAADELVIQIQWPALQGGAPDQTWLPKADQEDILRRARAAVRAPDPLSARPLAQITTALAETGWFESTPVARRSADGSIVIAADWRVPAAVVRHDGWDHLVSWSGMPMPRRYGPGTSNQRVILNAAFGPGPSEDPADRFRHAWPGEDVAAGLQLLMLLAERNLVEQVEAIDVAAHAAGKIEIATIFNTRIEWGAAPGKWRPGQANDDERLARLERLITEFGRIDGTANRVRIYGAHVERMGR
ncbi:MAG: hypothetical protein AAF297_07235 [Planctomycetota bacterium]